jgi:hypothetical protein
MSMAWRRPMNVFTRRVYEEDMGRYDAENFVRRYDESRAMAG